MLQGSDIDTESVEEVQVPFKVQADPISSLAPPGNDCRLPSHDFIKFIGYSCTLCKLTAMLSSLAGTIDA